MRLRLLATCFSFLFLIQFIVVVNVRGQQRHQAILSILKAASIPSPEDVIGFSPGDDRKLASWNQVVSYFQKLDEASDRVKFQVLGKTTMDAPFVLATISVSEDSGATRRSAEAREESGRKSPSVDRARQDNRSYHVRDSLDGSRIHTLEHVDRSPSGLRKRSSDARNSAQHHHSPGSVAQP
jgi:hypothetical protein